MRAFAFTPLLLVACAKPTGLQWPEADALFHQEPRWLGADSAYSIPLHGGGVLWLFGDTFVATSAALSRSESTIVRNSIAIQDGLDPLTATARFYWRGTAEQPQSFFSESDTDHWYWPAHGVCIDDTLVLFMQRVKSTPGDGLGFAADGWVALIVDDVRLPPLQWAPRPVRASNAPAGLLPSAATFDGDDVVVLAERDPGDHAGFIVRWSKQDLARGLLDDGVWSPQALVNAGAESSLHFDAQRTAWLHIMARGVGGVPVVMSQAKRPEGPWPASRVIFQPPETHRDGIWVYSAKAHPELLAPDGSLAITYNTNSVGDFNQLVHDTSIYYPRFFRLPAAGPYSAGH